MARILLLEPAEDMGGLLSEVLSSNGYDVDWQRGAEAAVHAADEKTPDAVVMELSIPEHNGVEFLHEFRSYAEWMEIPVIIHSHVAPDRSTDGKRLMNSMGIFEHLYKPTTNLRRLISVTQEALA